MFAPTLTPSVPLAFPLVTRRCGCSVTCSNNPAIPSGFAFNASCPRHRLTEADLAIADVMATGAFPLPACSDVVA